MLYHLLYPLSFEYGLFNIFRYITFRSILAFLLAIFTSLIVGHFFISYMRRKQFGQVVRDDGPQTHLKKRGTPTMGGVFIITSIFFTIGICGNMYSLPLLLASFATLSFFILGYLDDYLKISKKNTKGVPGKVKLLWQSITGLIIAYIAIKYGVVDTKLYIPFLKDGLLDFGNWYAVFIMLVVVGSSNAVNLTDGLDGLAIGPIITSAACLGILAYLAGHKELASYLYIPYIDGSGELAVLAAAVIGSGAGFLWYNSYPAQIFMGDVGSLSLGGTLGTIAVLTKNEILFVLIGGIFVMEAMSVIIQVTSYKLRQKRVFKMAPIHHHFELKGWPETKVIVRFWIIAACLAIVSLVTIKIR